MAPRALARARPPAPRRMSAIRGCSAYLLGADAERVEHDDQVTGKACETLVAVELLKHASWARATSASPAYRRPKGDDRPRARRPGRQDVAAVEVKAKASSSANWAEFARQAPRRARRSSRVASWSTPASRPSPWRPPVGHALLGPVGDALLMARDRLAADPPSPDVPAELRRSTRRTAASWSGAAARRTLRLLALACRCRIAPGARRPRRRAAAEPAGRRTRCTTADLANVQHAAPRSCAASCAAAHRQLMEAGGSPTCS